MIRIPFPIPEPDRSALIAAGMEACAQKETSNAKRDAQALVKKITDNITARYGKECVK